MRGQQTLAACCEPAVSVAETAAALVVALFSALGAAVAGVVEVDVAAVVGCGGVSAAPRAQAAQKVSRAVVAAAAVVGCGVGLGRAGAMVDTLGSGRLVRVLAVPPAGVYAGVAGKGDGSGVCDPDA